MEPPLAPSKISNVTAINAYLSLPEKEKTSSTEKKETRSDYRLVLQTEDGKKYIRCIKKIEVGFWEGFLAKFFKCGDACLQKVMEHALTKKVITDETRNKELIEKLFKNILDSNNRKEILKSITIKTMEAFTGLPIRFDSTKELLDFIKYNENVSPEDAQRLFQMASKEKIFTLAIESENEEIITFLHKNKILDAKAILLRLLQQAPLTEKQCAIICKLLSELLSDEKLAFDEKIKILKQASCGPENLIDSIVRTPALVGFLTPLADLPEELRNLVMQEPQTKKDK